MSPQKEIGSKQIEEILYELSECREDERSSQSQIVQTIGTAGTLLGVLFGVSVFPTTSQNQDLLHALFYSSGLIFCVAFGFVISIGISNVLRYYYIRELEDMLTKLVSDELSGEHIIHWMSFSSPILTRNLKHLGSPYSKSHFLSYLVAVLGAILFCLSIVGFLYKKLETHYIFDQIILYLFVVVAFISGSVFFYTTIRAQEMYKHSLSQSLISRNIRLDNSEVNTAHSATASPAKALPKSKRVLTALRYFLYPKLKDVQKSFLIIIGYLTGVFFTQGTSLLRFTPEQFYHMIATLIIIDFLIYQARYLWNDIRNVCEDMACGKRDRLPVWIIEKKSCIIIALLVLFLRITLAFVAIHLMDKKIQYPLIVCSLMIIGISILYELARTKENIAGTFFLVSLGYPIRFLAGLWVACPTIWNETIESDGLIMPNKISFIILLLVSYAFLGEFSAVLPWMHEAIALQTQYLHIPKKHYRIMLQKAEKRHQNYVKKHGISSLLQGKGNLLDPWNIECVISCLLLSLALFLPGFLSPPPEWIWIIPSEMLSIIISILLCRAERKTVLKLIFACTLWPIARSIWAIAYIKWYPLYVYVCINQYLFWAVYVYLRFFFQPDFDFGQICRKCIAKILHVIIGKNTMNYLRK